MDIKKVKVIGFDLDQTFYPKSPEIDTAIQEYIYHKIAEHKQCTFEEGKAMFCQHYPAISGRKTLIKLGVPNAEGIIQESLENADIAKFLVPDKKVQELLQHVKGKYGSLSIITGSSHKVCKQKLEALQIPISWFDCIIAGGVSKSDGTAFKEWMAHFQKQNLSLRPENFLYIGDRAMTDAVIPLQLGMQAILVNIKEKDESVKVEQLAKLVDIAKLLQLDSI